jgi:hypothetical protein
MIKGLKGEGCRTNGMDQVSPTRARMRTGHAHVMSRGLAKAVHNVLVHNRSLSELHMFANERGPYAQIHVRVLRTPARACGWPKPCMRALCSMSDTSSATRGAT